MLLLDEDMAMMRVRVKPGRYGYGMNYRRKARLSQVSVGSKLISDAWSAYRDA